MHYIKNYRSGIYARMFYEEPITVVLNTEDDWRKFSLNEFYSFKIVENPYYKSIDDDINEKRKNIKYIIEIYDCDLY